MSLLLAATLATTLFGAGINLGPAGLASFANYSLVEDPGQKPKELGFGGDFTLGYLATHSASTTTSLNTELKLGYNTPLWQHRLDLQAVSATDDGNTTAEQYFGAFQSNRLLSKRSYVFGYLGYIHDRFSGYRFQASEVAGYGIKAMDTKTQTLKFEFGAGWTQARQTSTDTQPGESKQSPAARVRQLYDWNFSDKNGLSQSLTLEKSSFNLYSQFDIKVTAQLVGNLAFVVGYSIQHNSTVTGDNPQTTSLASVSVQYAFGSIFKGS